ncbi:MAG: hypothetical protein CL936_02460, partial [Deltaproteobacteria bacterium]|nr:hypothetical protein [Deltaproteobacteria bacterium]
PAQKPQPAEQVIVNQPGVSSGPDGQPLKDKPVALNSESGQQDVASTAPRSLATKPAGSSEETSQGADRGTQITLKGTTIPSAAADSETRDPPADPSKRYDLSPDPSCKTGPVMSPYREETQWDGLQGSRTHPGEFEEPLSPTMNESSTSRTRAVFERASSVAKGAMGLLSQWKSSREASAEEGGKCSKCQQHFTLLKGEKNERLCFKCTESIRGVLTAADLFGSKYALEEHFRASSEMKGAISDSLEELVSLRLQAAEKRDEQRAPTSSAFVTPAITPSEEGTLREESLGRRVQSTFLDTCIEKELDQQRLLQQQIIQTQRTNPLSTAESEVLALQLERQRRELVGQEDQVACDNEMARHIEAGQLAERQQNDEEIARAVEADERPPTMQQPGRHADDSLREGVNVRSRIRTIEDATSGQRHVSAASQGQQGNQGQQVRVAEQFDQHHQEWLAGQRPRYPGDGLSPDDPPFDHPGRLADQDASAHASRRGRSSERSDVRVMRGGDRLSDVGLTEENVRRLISEQTQSISQSITDQLSSVLAASQAVISSSMQDMTKVYEQKFALLEERVKPREGELWKPGVSSRSESSGFTRGDGCPGSLGMTTESETEGSRARSQSPSMAPLHEDHVVTGADAGGPSVVSQAATGAAGRRHSPSLSEIRGDSGSDSGSTASRRSNAASLRAAILSKRPTSYAALAETAVAPLRKEQDDGCVRITNGRIIRRSMPGEVDTPKPTPSEIPPDEPGVGAAGEQDGSNRPKGWSPGDPDGGDDDGNGPPDRFGSRRVAHGGGGGPPPPPPDNPDQGTEWKPPATYHVPRAEKPSTDPPVMPNYKKDSVHVRAKKFNTWLSACEKPLANYIPTEEALWHWLCAYISRIRLFIMAIFPSLPGEVERAQYRLPEHELQPNEVEKPFYTLVNSWMQGCFPQGDGWALWLKDVNTTLNVYAGVKPQAKYSLREQLFFASWHLEIRPEDDDEVERMQLDCESFFFPPKMRALANEMLKYQALQQFRELFPWIPAVRHTKLRTICVKMHSVIQSLDTATHREPEVHPVYMAISDLFVQMKIRSTTDWEVLIDFMLKFIKLTEPLCALDLPIPNRDSLNAGYVDPFRSDYQQKRAATRRAKAARKAGAVEDGDTPNTSNSARPGKDTKGKGKGKGGKGQGDEESGTRRRTYQGRVDADNAKILLRAASGKACPAFQGGCCNLGGTCRLFHPPPRTPDQYCAWCGNTQCKPENHKIFDGTRNEYIRFVNGQQTGQKELASLRAGYCSSDFFPKKFCKKSGENKTIWTQAAWDLFDKRDRMYADNGILGFIPFVIRNRFTDQKMSDLLNRNDNKLKQMGITLIKNPAKRGSRDNPKKTEKKEKREKKDDGDQPKKKSQGAKYRERAAKKTQAVIDEMEANFKQQLADLAAQKPPVVVTGMPAPPPQIAGVAPPGRAAATTTLAPPQNSIALPQQVAVEQVRAAAAAAGSYAFPNVHFDYATGTWHSRPCRPARAGKESAKPVIMVDSGTAFSGLPGEFVKAKGDTTLEVGEMTRTNTVPMSSERKNGVADLMLLPKEAGDDLAMSPHKLNTRYTLPEICHEMPEDAWQRVVDFYREVARESGCQMFRLVRDRGVDVIDPDQHEEFLKAIGYDKLLTDKAKQKLYHNTSATGRGTHNHNLTPAGNSASHFSPNILPAMIAASVYTAAEDRSRFFVELNHAKKAGLTNKWLATESTPPAPEPEAPMPILPPDWTVADLVTRPQLRSEPLTKGFVAACGCVDLGGVKVDCTSCRNFEAVEDGDDDIDQRIAAARAPRTILRQAKPYQYQNYTYKDGTPVLTGSDAYWKIRAVDANEKYYSGIDPRYDRMLRKAMRDALDAGISEEDQWAIIKKERRKPRCSVNCVFNGCTEECGKQPDELKKELEIDHSRNQSLQKACDDNPKLRSKLQGKSFSEASLPTIDKIRDIAIREESKKQEYRWELKKKPTDLRWVKKNTSIDQQVHADAGEAGQSVATRFTDLLNTTNADESLDWIKTSRVPEELQNELGHFQKAAAGGKFKKLANLVSNFVRDIASTQEPDTTSATRRAEDCTSTPTWEDWLREQQKRNESVDQPSAGPSLPSPTAIPEEESGQRQSRLAATGTDWDSGLKQSRLGQFVCLGCGDDLHGADHRFVIHSCERCQGQAKLSFAWSPELVEDSDNATIAERSKAAKAQRRNDQRNTTIPDLRVLVKPGGAMPTRATDRAAGIDLYTPVDTWCYPGKITRIPLSIHMAIPVGTVGLIMSRSSLAAKGLTIAGGVIDSDYRGELVVMLYNYGEPHLLRLGDRCAQMLIFAQYIGRPLASAPFHIREADELESTQRKGGFGSTGRRAPHLDQPVMIIELPPDTYQHDVCEVHSRSDAKTLSGRYSLDPSQWDPINAKLVMWQNFTNRRCMLDPWSQFFKICEKYDSLVRVTTFSDTSAAVDLITKPKSSASFSDEAFKLSYTNQKVVHGWGYVKTEFYVIKDRVEIEREKALQKLREEEDKLRKVPTVPQKKNTTMDETDEVADIGSAKGAIGISGQYMMDVDKFDPSKLKL